MKLKHLIETAKISNAFNCEKVEISSVTDHADNVKPAALFVAIKGKVNDGHNFLSQAIKNKAAAIAISDNKKELIRKIPFYKGGIITTPDPRKFLVRVLSKFYYSYASPNPLHIIGVTGTNGKTTTCFLLDRILTFQGKKVGKFTTTEFDIGLERGDSVMTTPDVFTLQSGLKSMRDAGCNVAVVEVSSHGIDQYRIDPFQIDVAILTNITQDHLDYHNNMRNYICCKRRLFEELNPNSWAVLNRDDRVFDEFKNVTPAKVISYGIEKSADFVAHSIKTNITGSEFRLIYPDGEVKLRTSLIGIYNIYNILAAITASYVLNIKPEQIISKLKNFETISGRLQQVNTGKNFKLFVDYAHTPDALEKVLRSIKPNCKGKLILVFGCGGDRDTKKRPLMGRIASLYSDFFIITNDNPRKEKPEKIIYDIKQGIPCLPAGRPCLSAGRPSNNGKFDIVLDRTEAIHKAINKADRDDIVIIAGKGHEKYQIVGDTRVYFDDVEVAREALKF